MKYSTICRAKSSHISVDLLPVLAESALVFQWCYAFKKRRQLSALQRHRLPRSWQAEAARFQALVPKRKAITILV